MTNLSFTVKATAKRTPLGAMYWTYKQKKLYREWIRAGKPVPPPHLVKRQTIKEYAERFGVHVFIETGTFLGDMVNAIKDTFDEVYSIELDMKLYQNAKKRFANAEHVTILQGDSGQLLGEVLRSIDRPCIFWLDGHYSAGLTAKGSVETPIREELSHISRHSIARRHVVLIDDARHFSGEGDYPSIQMLENWARSAGFDSLKVENDIISIHNTLQ